jgi:hypothetical protein
MLAPAQHDKHVNLCDATQSLDGEKIYKRRRIEINVSTFMMPKAHFSYHSASAANIGPARLPLKKLCWPSRKLN